MNLLNKILSIFSAKRRQKRASELSALVKKHGKSISIFTPLHEGPTPVGTDLGEGYFLAVITDIKEDTQNNIEGFSTYGVMLKEEVWNESNSRGELQRRAL